MKRLAAVLMTIGLIALPGCSGNDAPGLFETAKFEELQNNREHAIQLYEEIVKKYPRSEYADKAKKRLGELREDTPAN